MTITRTFVGTTRTPTIEMQVRVTYEEHDGSEIELIHVELLPCQWLEGRLLWHKLPSEVHQALLAEARQHAIGARAKAEMERMIDEH